MIDASAVRIDIHASDLAQQLRDLNVGLVIHTAGPYQHQDYVVARAVAQAGAHYIDLADGRRFVCDFPAALDQQFRQAGKIGICGASTVPALSGAIVDKLTAGWQTITSITSCIAPAHTAPRGVATMAAVLDYCGAPIQVWQHGAWQTQYGWSAPQQVAFARLRARAGALCDIPDLELFPARYPGVQTVMFRAALEIGFSQYVLAMLAWLRRRGLLRHPERLAGLLNGSADYLNWLGSSTGGMVLEVNGLDTTGGVAQRAWHITAPNDHGPEIPAMPAILLARRIASGQLTDVGAHTSMGWLTLADFAPEFAKWGMTTDEVS